MHAHMGKHRREPPAMSNFGLLPMHHACLLVPISVPHKSASKVETCSESMLKHRKEFHCLWWVTQNNYISIKTYSACFIPLDDSIALCQCTDVIPNIFCTVSGIHHVAFKLLNLSVVVFQWRAYRFLFTQFELLASSKHSHSGKFQMQGT